MKKVIARVAIEFVTTPKAGHGVIIIVLTILLLVITNDFVITCAAIDDVITVVARDGVITCVARDGVITAEAKDEVAKEPEIEEKANHLQSELSSLVIQCKRKNEFNDNEELQALTTAIKEVYFQDYKIAYNNTSDTEIDQSHFGHLIEIDVGYLEGQKISISICAYY